MFERYKEDIQCFMEHDPAARSPIEIVLLYPGFKALRSHRKAQWFLNHKMPFIARYISQRTAHKTGIRRAQLGLACPAIWATRSICRIR